MHINLLQNMCIKTFMLLLFLKIHTKPIMPPPWLSTDDGMEGGSSLSFITLPS